MDKTPHPSTLASISAATGRRLQKSDIDDAGRRRPKKGTPGPYTAKNVAGYRFPDGRTNTTYDMYAPTYPDGSEPGLVDVHYEIEYFANGDHGYKPNILAFRSIDDLAAQGLKVDMTAAALAWDQDSTNILVVGSDEKDLEQKLSASSAKMIVRAPITIPENLEGPLQFFYAAGVGDRCEIRGADTEDRLDAMLRERYDFIKPKSSGLSGMLEAMEENSKRPDITWRVAYLDRTQELA